MSSAAKDPACLGSIAYRKHFIPLESNPEVFTELIHKLGIPKSLEFQDVLSLDDPDLLSFLSRPAYALILVFPTTEAYEKKVRDEDSQLQLRNNQAEGDVRFFKQTINNACGLYAILHAVCNGEATMKIAKQTFFDRLQEQAKFLGLEDCALAIEADVGLEQAYDAVARKGSTEAPDNAEDEVDYHYICFVKSSENSHLYQLDGDSKQPLDLGLMAAGEDVLSDKCLDVIRGMIASEEGNLNFSLMALVQAQS